MAAIPDISAGQAAAGIGGGAALTELTVGLDRASAAAGDVLTGIFGGLPWEMAPEAIVDAVGGGSATLVGVMPL